MMPDVRIRWTRYEHFFELYNRHKNEPKLIYIIGENHHCYIGSVGSKGGQDGLAQRYQKQYIDRAKAIFGSDAPDNQPAYVGHFINPINPDPELIIAVEKTIQYEFINKVGRNKALFTTRGYAGHIGVESEGDHIPPFLINHNVV